MKCIHHSDIDGHCAGNIVAIYEKNFNPEDYIEMDYVARLPLEKIKKGERVYIVDYSFSINTESVLDSLLEITSDIIWLDHHASSVELIEKRPDFGKIKGVRQEGISGAALAYMFLANLEYEKIPEYVKYVSDFDCWLLTMPNVMDFKFGVEGNDHSVLSKLWENFFKDQKDNIFLNQVINYGKYANEYSKVEYARYLEDYGYETEVDGLKCLAVNRRSFSAIFGEKLKEYPLCMVWVYDGKTNKYSYSIYSSKPETVNCSKIAQKFGGGGHPSAAGFSSDRYMF